MQTRVLWSWCVGALIVAGEIAVSAEPQQGDTKQADLGNGIMLETVFIPAGEFLMGSTSEEKRWATGIEGGAQAGTERESYEGEQPRAMKVP